MRDERLRDAVILVVDDEQANVLLLRRLLAQAGYGTVHVTTDPREVPAIYAETNPDLILLDLHMPHLDGFEVLELLVPQIPAGDYLPVLVLTADVAPEAKRRALTMGAKDFLTKPFDSSEVLLRIHNLLETRHLHRQLQEYNRLLEVRVLERTQELEEARIEILERLAIAAEFRDDATGEHTRRVGRIAAVLAEAFGLPPAEVELIRRAAPLHDIGKIGIPDGILLKPGPLTGVELDTMKSHTIIGARILSGSRVPLLQLAEKIALSHHEHWDGTGYPHALGGEQIALGGRIVAVADAFDAMTSDRPYRKALGRDEVWSLLFGGAGTQWDERLVQALATALATDSRAAALVAAASRRDTIPAP